MASSRYPNRHQYAFLQKLREQGDGLPTQHWPEPATMKRWLNHDGFKRAMINLIVTMRFEQDMMTASAGKQAARMLQDLFVKNDFDEVEKYGKAVNSLCRMVRVDHMRQKEVRVRRVAAKKKPVPAPPPEYSLEGAQAALNEAQRKLEDAEILVEMMSLKNPFPDYRRGVSGYYNPVTDRRELEDWDVPADECGKGMDRVTKYYARHAREKAQKQARDAAWEKARQKTSPG